MTPTVMDRDLIRLQIVPEFSAIDGANTVNGIPGTTVKRVQTTVELREGQTLALGGLISRQTTTTINRIPFLGDIPFVGSRLFQSKNATEDEVELLVLVTPEIVRPMEPDEVPPLPNYYITHPNDHDLYKYGRSEGSPDTTVYQTQPFGTGMTQGNPAGYSLQDASVLPQFTMPQKPVFVPEPIELPSSRFSGQPGLLPQPDPQMSPAQGYSLPAPTQQQPFPVPVPTEMLPPVTPPPQLPVPIPMSAAGPATGAAVRKPMMSRLASAFRRETTPVAHTNVLPVNTDTRR